LAGDTAKPDQNAVSAATGAAFAGFVAGCADPGADFIDAADVATGAGCAEPVDAAVVAGLRGPASRRFFAI
jgi:hypothetical protein